MENNKKSIRSVEHGGRERKEKVVESGLVNKTWSEKKSGFVGENKAKVFLPLTSLHLLLFFMQALRGGRKAFAVVIGGKSAIFAPHGEKAFISHPALQRRSDERT